MMTRLSLRPPAPGIVPAIMLVLAACNGPDSPPGGMPPAQSDPGRVTLHRLNRVEYNNTVHDLLGTEQRPADDFPSDDRGYGFDNIADVLSLSPLQIELYQRAAELLVDEAMRVPIPMPKQLRFAAIDVKSTVGGATNGAWNLWSNGDVVTSVMLPADGDYEFSARVWGQQAGPDPVRMSIQVDGMARMTFDVKEVAAAPAIYTVSLPSLKAGAHTFGVSFLNDYYNPMQNEDRNLFVDWIQARGPLNAKALSNPLRDRLVTCDPRVKGAEPCAREVIGNFARRALRRLIPAEELDRYLGFLQAAVKENDPEPFETGVRLALQAILISPHFLFRVEMDADPASAAPHPLDDFELASRLSYFLWSTTPDDALLALAEMGALHDPAVLKAQVARMLADPRAEALVANFAGQWLFFRGLVDHAVDYAAFPDYNNDLMLSMRGETERFFREFLFKDIGMDGLLSAGFTFVDARLAKHYGLPYDAQAGGWQRASLSGPRRGLLGHASLLTVTSYPARTSPVKRGKWVLDQLLCAGPPPPPPNVEGLKPQEIPTGSLRQRLEEHRNNPLCAACHTSMDPIGFGLEHFDGIGRWRDDDGGFPIDASGILPGGAKFDGSAALAQLLGQDPRFPRCVTQQLYTYALGRGPAYDDDKYIDGIAADFVAGGYRLKDLIAQIVTSEAFRMRRGEPGGGK